jgi:hypothetical protein
MLSLVAGTPKSLSSELLCLTATLLLCASTTTDIALAQDGSHNPTPNVSMLPSPPSPRAFVIGPRTPINPPDVGYHSEVMAAADPESANNLIVCGFRANPRTGSAYEGYVYQSGDGGATWREALVDSRSQWVSEESCAFGPGHQAYFASGVSNTSRGEPYHEYGNLYLYRSSDSGRTWQTIQIGRFMDYTSMTVDSTAGPQRNTLYIFANNLADGAGGWLGSGPTDPSSDKRPFLAALRELPEPSFSVTNGNFNVDDEGVRFRGKYPAGSAVLSDGTVLSIFSGDKEVSTDVPGKKTHVFYVAAGISDDGGKTLRKTIVYQNAVPSVLEGIAVDQTTDEVYVCWTPRHERSLDSDIMLATSRDKGHTWSVKSVTSPRSIALDLRVGTVSLAINKDGVLGFMWYGKNGERAYFGASFDGGNSITEVVRLTPNSPVNSARDAELADDRRLVVYPPSWNTSSNRLEPLTILALGQNVSGVPAGNALVADRNGSFHPIWSEVANGPTHLWTRTISLQLPGKAARVPTSDGLTDISERVVSHITNVQYDHLENLVAFDITVTNKSDKAVDGPMMIVATGARGKSVLAAGNADNGKEYDGALWELQIPRDGLSREHSTEPRTLTFHLDIKNAEVSGEYTPYEIPLRIYGRQP